MGRRTCEKPKVRYRKGLWSPEEDERLRNYILRHGHGNWSSIPAEAGLQRNGKSCRLRWLNYLRPGLKRGIFSPQEVATVVKLHSMLGNKWSQIALHLPGRTDNEVKNYWNSYLKKKVVNVEGSESHASTPNSENSTNQNKKSMQLSEESNNQISLSGCSGSTESCSEDSFRSRQHMMKNVSHQATHLPKLLFADWISMDHAKSQSLLYNSDGGMTCPRVSTSNTKVNGTELLQDNLPSTYDVIHEFGDISNYGEFKWQFDRGEPSSEGSIFDLLPLVENCSDFQMNHDITF